MLGQKKITTKRNFVHRGLLAFALAILFSWVGLYFLYSSYADAVRQPKIQVSHTADGTKNIVNNANVGDIIQPEVWDKTFGFDATAPHKIALIVSVYYISERATPIDVVCNKNLRCTSVLWPAFSPLQTWTGATDVFYNRVFSVCVDEPRSYSSSDLLLFIPRLRVIKTNDAIPLHIAAQYYSSVTSCATNGGKGSASNQRNAGFWRQCYNREGSQTDGSDYQYQPPTDCGYPGEGNATSVGIKITGGLGPGKTDNKSKGEGKDGEGKGAGNGSGGGGSGGSTAKTQSDEPNTLPNSSKQGNNKQPDLDPSPFYDGKEYKAGSASDTIFGGLFARQNNGGVATGWQVLAALVIIAGIALGGFFWWRKQKKI